MSTNNYTYHHKIPISFITNFCDPTYYMKQLYHFNINNPCNLLIPTLSRLYTFISSSNGNNYYHYHSRIFSHIRPIFTNIFHLFSSSHTIAHDPTHPTYRSSIQQKTIPNPSFYIDLSIVKPLLRPHYTHPIFHKNP